MHLPISLVVTRNYPYEQLNAVVDDLDGDRTEAEKRRYDEAMYLRSFLLLANGHSFQSKRRHTFSADGHRHFAILRRTILAAWLLRSNARDFRP